MRIGAGDNQLYVAWFMSLLRRYQRQDVVPKFAQFIADLTDHLLSKEEVNGLFQVVTEQFRSIRVDGGKLLALDEAHKFMDGVKSDGPSEAIVDVARLMHATRRDHTESESTRSRAT